MKFYPVVSICLLFSPAVSAADNVDIDDPTDPRIIQGPKQEAVGDSVMVSTQSIDSADAPVTDGAKARLTDLRAEWDVLVADYQSIANGDIAAFNALL